MSRLKKKFTIAFQLSSVSRFSRDYMTKQENVLEHIGFCTFYATLLAQEMEMVGVRLDYKKLMLSVAAHDLDESILGDIPRTTKYFNESVREEFKGIEEETVVCLDKWLNSNLLPHWKNAKNGIEGQILKVTDIAAVVYKNWAEIEFLGNRSFLRVCVETGEYLRSLDTSEYHPILAAELHDIMDENEAILKNHEVLEADVLFLTLKKGK